MTIFIQQVRIFGTSLLFASLLSACGGGGDSTAVAPLPTCGTPTTGTLPVQTVSTAISTPTTWSAGNVYYLSSSINVDAALTIQPGAVIKFATTTPGGAMLTVGASGSITANGTSNNNIIFTSYKDDSVGGDSNGDAAAATPVVGDWGKIALTSNGSLFNYTRFCYGGKTNSTLDIGYGTARSATVTNSTFAHNNGGNSSLLVAASTDAVGSLDASLATAATVITGNTFYDNKVPLSISGAFNVDDSNTFHDPAVTTTKNKYNGIFMVGNSYKAITGSITFSETEVPYVLAGYIDVPDTAQLTLGDNVIIKFFATSSTLNTNYNANGGTATTTQIIANASAGNKIVFTSYRDDSHGGDTNGDGVSTGTVGDWARIVLNANGSVFNRCEFYYGGWDTANRETLNLTGYSATVTNSIFAHNHGGDFSALPFVYGVINADGATAGTNISSNTFYDNRVPLLISGSFSVDDSNVFHDPANTSVTNTFNGIFHTGNSADYISTISLSETEVPFVFHGDIYVTTGNTLTIGDNVVFKFSGTATQLTYTGSVVNATGAGVVFTSVKDDVYKGDTNGDGSSSGVANDWMGVRNSSNIFITQGNTFYNRCPGGAGC
jgi:hypothetical protein